APPPALHPHDGGAGPRDGTLKHRLNDNLSLAVDDAGLVADQNLGEAMGKIPGKIETRLDNDLAALVDIAKSSANADRSQAFAERHGPLETRWYDFLFCRRADIAAKAEFAIAIPRARLRSAGRHCQKHEPQPCPG